MNSPHLPQKAYFYKKLYEFRKRNGIKSGKGQASVLLMTKTKSHSEEEMALMGGEEAADKLSDEQLSQWRKKKLKAISIRAFSDEDQSIKF